MPAQRHRSRSHRRAARCAFRDRRLSVDPARPWTEPPRRGGRTRHRFQVLDTSIATSSTGSALARIAEEHDVDIVHAHGEWDLRPAFQGPCRWGRRPLVQTVYEMDVSSQTYPHQALIVGTRYLLEEQRKTRPGPIDLISPRSI